ncbi:MAG: hypothetical protein JNJ56_11070 [Ignavibacteria bacterium]|nr:hypothetical protein [Ignavibacteria bacterium]
MNYLLKLSGKYITEKYKYIIFIILLVCLITVCIPRFDRADYGPVKHFAGNEELYEGLPFDIMIYRNYIEYFRNGTGEDKITAPYSYRVLVPFLASLMPFEPLTSLNLVNLIFLISGLLFLYLIMCETYTGFQFRIAGCLMFIFSFPVFYYTTSGYIDGTVIGLMLALIYFIISRKRIPAVITLITGVLASEKIIIILPFLIAFIYSKEYKTTGSYVFVFLFLLIYSLTVFLLRKYAPGVPQSYVWLPDERFFSQNIFRVKAYLSFVLTFGIPGLIALFSYFKFPPDKRKKYLCFYTGCITSLLLYAYSFFSAWADGRTVWTIYPFAVPVSALYLEYLYKQKTGIA